MEKNRAIRLFDGSACLVKDVENFRIQRRAQAFVHAEILNAMTDAQKADLVKTLEAKIQPA